MTNDKKNTETLPMYDVEELNEIVKLYNDKEIDLYTFIGRVWNKAYILGANEATKSFDFLNKLEK
jgi:hypothetical protein